jgi:2-haloacid dehalogenase
MQIIKNIIFDLGGVLVDWSPDYMYKKLITDENQRKIFLETICTLDWNEQQDGGRAIEEANRELISMFPEHKDLIEAYYARWEEMLGGPIQPTVEIFRQLKQAKKCGIYALTNWSAETFPRALELFDFLHWFDGRIVSGEEKTRKPFKEIYDLTLSRFNLVASETLFIDDNLRNIKAANELGIITHHFISPEQLNDYLKSNDLF